MPAQHPEDPEIRSPEELGKIYTEIARRSAQLVKQYYENQLRDGITVPTDELGIGEAFADMGARLMASPFLLAQSHMALMRDYFSLWQNTFLQFFGQTPKPVAVPEKGDNRFKGAEWHDNLVFDFIKQSYLVTARHLLELTDQVGGLSPEGRKKVRFYTRQYIDALSPANFALTNPEVLRETARTQGQNLLKGYNNLLRDIDEGHGRLHIRMSDTNAFEPGRNVAATPGKVIFQNELIQLLQFAPATQTQFRRPLLIIPPWINKYYILDLRQSNSFIKWASEQGHTVFVISWVNPDARLAEKDFEDYLTEGALAALDATCRQSGCDEVNLIGYCLGGTLLGSLLGYNAVKKDRRIVSATFFVALLDFSIPGDLGVFIDEQQVTHLEERMAERGYLEGSEMATTFNMLRSNDLIWSFVVNNYLMGRDPAPFDLLYWNSDSTRMPYRMHSFYLRNMYMKNLLREPGGITLDGVPIDIGKTRVPAYFISTIEDHIAPWQSTYLGATRLGGPVRFVLGGSGHIAGIVNPPAANKYGYWTHEADTLPATPQAWQAAATQHAGSWWSDWQQWISALNGAARVPARDPAAGVLQPIEDAPGSFVKFRLDQQTGSV